MSSQPDLWTVIVARGYPRRAGFKERTTSRDAAHRIDAKGRERKLRAAVLAWYQAGNTGTADEVADALNESVLSVRPRVAQLHKLDDLEPTGERRRNASGASAHVWRATRRAG